MALANGEAHLEEMLQAQAHVINHLFSFARSMALKCAIELSIPDIVHSRGGTASLTDLATTLDLPPGRKQHLHRVMRLLVNSGFFTSTTPSDIGGLHGETYQLTPSSRLLLKGNKNMTMVPFVLMELHPDLMSPWHKLSAWLTHKDLTPFELAHDGSKIWEYASKHDEINDLFNGALASDSLLTMGVFVSKCGRVLEGLRSWVDVGGGTGSAAKVIAEAFPGIKCTVLDLPHVVASAPEIPGVEFVPGDMFKFVPKGDAVFLKNVLHDWSDEECVQILQRCKEAIASRDEGGRVILVEVVVGSKPKDPTYMETIFYLDLLMVAHTDGKEREEHEWKKIFEDAGFSHYEITPALGMRSVIELFP